MKTAFATTLLLAAVIQVNAQLAVGLKLGHNFASKTASLEPHWKSGINGGLVTKFNASRVVYVEAEALYSQQGWSETIYTPQGRSRRDIDLHYFSVPILLGFKVYKKVDVLAGIQYAHLMKLEDHTNPAYREWAEYNTEDDALLAGVRFNMTKAFAAEFRYVRGATPIIAWKRRVIGGDMVERYRADGNNRTLQLSLTYLFEVISAKKVKR
jgi:hypothetical protein